MGALMTMITSIVLLRPKKLLRQKSALPQNRTKEKVATAKKVNAKRSTVSASTPVLLVELTANAKIVPMGNAQIMEIVNQSTVNKSQSLKG